MQAMSGLAWLSGDAGQGPVPVGLSMADLMAGAQLCQGVLALLVRRGRTGRGGRVDVSLLESAIDMQFEQLTAFLNGDGRQPPRDAVNNASVYLGAPYGIYQTADGWLALAMAPLGKLAELTGCKALEAYADPATWFKDRASIKALLAEHLARKPTAHWLALLEPADIWCAPVLDWPQLVRHDGFAALELTQEIENPEHGVMRTTRCPLRVDGEVLTSPRGAPALGADNEEILRRIEPDAAGSDCMIVEQYFEDYEIGFSRRTLGRTLTEADIVIHAGQTGDFFPHHMDAEWCATQDFKQRIAHGTLVLSVGIGMTASTINPRAMSYGYDRVRFIRPVFIGDTLTVTARITEKRDHPKRKTHGVVVEAVEIANQRAETGVWSCEHLYLVERRSAAP